MVLDINNEWAVLISSHLKVQIRLIKNKLYYITVLKTSLSLVQVQMNGYSKFDLYVLTGLIKSQAHICRARQNFLFLQRLLATWDSEKHEEKKKHLISVEVERFFYTRKYKHCWHEKCWVSRKAFHILSSALPFFFPMETAVSVVWTSLKAWTHSVLVYCQPLV